MLRHSENGTYFTFGNVQCSEMFSATIIVLIANVRTPHTHHVNPSLGVTVGISFAWHV